ncbi:tyrosine-type recombinase/integrase [Erythrobacter sp. HA6-11]
MRVYEREGSPFWWYTFTAHGVRFRGSTRKKSKREAELIAAKLLQDKLAQRTRAQPWRLRECLGAYWQEHLRHKPSGDGAFPKLDALSRILRPDTLITDITNADLMDYRAARVAEGLQPHGVNRDLAYLKAAMRYANTMHGKDIPPIAWSKIRMAEPAHRIRFLSKDEYHRLLDHCPENVALIVKVAVATGLRKNNILKLDWREVDLSSGLITVKVKGGKLHRVKLPPPLRAALSTLPSRTSGARADTGQVFETKNFRKLFEKAVADAGIEDFRFHDLRHTCATWMRMAGVDLIDICEALGHSNISVTMRYAHIDPETHESPFDRISARVWSQSESHSGEKRRKS